MKQKWVKNRLPNVSGIYIVMKDGIEVTTYFSAILQQFDACEKKQPIMWREVTNND